MLKKSLKSFQTPMLILMVSWLSMLMPAHAAESISGIEQSGISFTVQLDYDNTGRLMSVQHPGGREQAYTYNSQVAHDSVSYGGQVIVTDTDYNAAGLPTGFDVTSVPGQGTPSVSRSYDNLNRLKSLRVTGNGTLYNATNVLYDNWGFVSSVSRSDSAYSGTLSYQYGQQGELMRYTASGVGSVNYSYDLRGNLLSHGALNGQFTLPALSTQSYNASNQRSGSDWQYDPQGKLEQDPDFEYAYNYLEQIESITDRQTGSVLTHYLYDGNGERVREVIDDQVVYSIRGPGGQLLSQEIHQTRIDGGMDVTRKDFVYHNGQVVLTVTHHPNGEREDQYQFRDRQGHPVLVLDEADGFSPQYREYSPFGEQMLTAQQDQVTHEFTGHERDEVIALTGADAQLDYLHLRYYNRERAQFLRPDPAFDFNVHNPFSYNLYSYTFNNPINRWDPTGLQTVEQSIDAQILHHAENGNHVRGYLFTVLKVAWMGFGMESLSQVADNQINGRSSSGGEVGWAVLDVATLGKGGGVVAGARHLAGKAIWKLNPFKRGNVIEKLVGKNLPSNFPVIDRYKDGIVTSIKSLDLNAKSYQRISNLQRTVRSYIRKVESFNGRRWAGTEVLEKNITGRALDLVVPRGAASAAQRKALDELVEYGAQRGVRVNIQQF